MATPPPVDFFTVIEGTVAVNIMISESVGTTTFTSDDSLVTGFVTDTEIRTIFGISTFASEGSFAISLITQATLLEVPTPTLQSSSTPESTATNGHPPLTTSPPTPDSNSAVTSLFTIPVTSIFQTTVTSDGSSFTTFTTQTTESVITTVVRPPASVSGSALPPSPASSSHASHNSLPGIIGGIVGVLAVMLALGIGLTFYFGRRRRIAQTSATPHILDKRQDIESAPTHAPKSFAVDGRAVPLPSLSLEPGIGVPGSTTPHDEKSSYPHTPPPVSAPAQRDVEVPESVRIQSGPPDRHIPVQAAGEHVAGETAPERLQNANEPGVEGLRTDVAQIREQMARMELLLLQQREDRRDNSGLQRVRAEGSRESNLTLSPPPEYASN